MDGRVLLLFPAPHPLGVLLIGSHQRSLRGQPEAAQDFAYPLHGVLHTEFPLDHLPYQLACPQGEVQLELPRIAPDDDASQLGHLSRGELRLWTGCLLHYERLQALFPVGFHPTINRGSTTLEDVSRIIQVHALLHRMDHQSPRILKRPPRNPLPTFLRHGSIIPQNPHDVQ